MASFTSVPLQPSHVQSDPPPVLKVPPYDTQSPCAVCVTGVLAPLSDADAVAAGFFPDTVNVPLSVEPAVSGAYCTVTLHCFFGPNAVPLQLSAVIENANDPDNNALKLPVALPPEFRNTNVCEPVVFASIVP
jgi:hypothetical protein